MDGAIEYLNTVRDLQHGRAAHGAGGEHRRHAAVVESLAEPLRSAWDACAHREMNVGYDCGSEPWAFDQGLSPELLGRMAAAGASLRITLYPERPEL